ncbi:conserved hypothetical protein [Roseibium sp. TrichSKD4]|uniref:TadE/TadG family type IV pilus assembly protein n=1 Tax=Roseibium sp. TrichSKD4 TaxID=744980 RepID=UPI0001E56360|nr:Tad domain-containing protein [Roseibium sp. TrichSKD4]EFO34571.1 conserved hypothetical protein [Roseibium sp. TrichSKD4]
MIITAFVFFVLIVAIGVGVDYSRALTLKTRVLGSLDTAALAAAVEFSKLGSEQDARKAAKKAFDAQVSQLNLHGAKLKKLNIVTDDETMKVSVDAVFELPTTLMQIAGFKTLEVATRSDAVGGGQEVILDIVMCIDATGSMGATLRSVQRNALSFEANLKNRLKELGRQVDIIRVRPIYYWDYDYDGWSRSYGLKKSTFLKLPDQRTQFKNFVDSESAYGGGDWPEAGLECFNEGLRSSWFKTTNTRQSVFPVVALWTDAPADSPNNWRNINSSGTPYPSNMPRSWGGLEAAWNNGSLISQDNKMFVFFGNQSQNGWRQLSKWSGYNYGGSLTSATNNMVEAIANAVYKKLPPPYLSF